MQINIVNQLKSVDFSMAKNLTLIFLFIGEMEPYQFLLCIYLQGLSWDFETAGANQQ